MQRIKVIFSLFMTCLGSACIKIFLLQKGVIPFNSDEAIVGLMARHILTGEKPIFFYGQSYMGSLDAFLVAAGFAFFSPSVWVIRAIQISLFMLTIITTGLIGRVAFRSWKTGIIAGIFMAVPTVNVTLYTTASLGGYGEALLIGSILLLVCFLILEEVNLPSSSQNLTKILTLFSLWGFFAGLGLWSNGITLVFSIPCGIALIFRLFRNENKNQRRSLAFPLLVMAVGLIIGTLPLWIYLFQNGYRSLLFELLGSAVAVERQSWLARLANHALHLLVLGMPVTFGFRPPWSVEWLVKPLSPLVLLFWLAVLFYWARKLVGKSGRQSAFLILSGPSLLLVAGFLFTSFGVDPSGRYFLPLAIPMSLVAANFLVEGLTKPWMRIIGLFLILSFNLMGTLQCAGRNPPGLTTQFDASTIIDHRYDQALIQFLKNNSVRNGYTNYWVAYPIAFLSNEEVVFVPKLPYHQDLRYTARDNRYLPYNNLVDSSSQIAYITTRNPALDSYLRNQFIRVGVDWEFAQIGDYFVYYNLSEVIRPEEMGLAK